MCVTNKNAQKPLRVILGCTEGRLRFVIPVAGDPPKIRLFRQSNQPEVPEDGLEPPVNDVEISESIEG
jgi:hypothetical protein